MQTKLLRRGNLEDALIRPHHIFTLRAAGLGGEGGQGILLYRVQLHLRRQQLAAALLARDGSDEETKVTAEAPTRPPHVYPRSD